jgi:tetratricopeptide (TPR) repeat protein
MGRLDEAVNELERARELDPFSIPINYFLGETLYYARRYDEAILQFRRALEMHPESAGIHDGIADVYEQKNMLAEAFAERQQVLAANGNTKSAAVLDQVYKRSGYKGYLLQRVASLEHAPKSGPLPDLYLAHLNALLNDQPQVLRYLEHAYDQRNPWLLNVQVDPAMDSMRSLPGFRDLVRRIGLPFH